MQQLALDFVPQTGYAPEDFVVSEANRQAYDAVMRWPQWDAPILRLSGPPGSGKTHLAAVWNARAHAAVLSAAALGTQPSEALLTGANAFCLDNIDQADEAGLFHALQHMAAQKAAGEAPFLLLVAPDKWKPALPDLASRLHALPHTRLLAPDDALLTAVLTKQFADRQLAVSPAVVQFLAARAERSFSAVAALADALDKAALTHQKAITLPLAREVLESFH